MPKATRDQDLIRRFIAQARKRDLSIGEMAAEVGMSMSWGRFLVRGKISVLRFRTRNRILRFLEDR